MKKLFFTLLTLGMLLPAHAQFTQDFEASNGNRGYDWGNCWEMGAIAYRNKANEVISGNWSARSNQLTNPSPSACWIKTPWLTWTAGNVSMDIQLSAKNGGSRGVLVRMIDYDPLDPPHYQANPSDTVFYYEYPKPFSTNVVNLSFPVPAQYQDGNPYRMMISFVGQGGNSRIFSDNYSFPATYYSDPANNCQPLSATPPIVDTDGDGVADGDDDFPNDPNLAYRTVYPSPSTFASVAFEDLWPAYGDYDFNDLVVDFQIEFLASASSDVSNINLTFYTRAVGAGMVNGFGFEVIGMDPSTVASVSGTILTEGIVNEAANGTEAGQPNVVIIPFDNVENVINRVGSPFYNTLDDGLVGISDTQEVNVTLNTPIAQATLLAYNFNPFLIKNRDRSMEVHLPDYPPTALADQSIFGTEDDDSDPTQNRYYKSPTNLPWAMQLDTRFEYPVEYVDILDAYLDFAQWAQSAGSQQSDWYLPTARRNDANIY